MSRRWLIVSLVAGAAVFGTVFGATLLDSAPFMRAETADQTPARSPRPPAAALPDLTAVAERALQASVNISSTQYVRLDPFQQFFYGGDAIMPQQSLGSGVIVSSDGYVVTNEHVVGNARAEIRVTLPDGRELPAKVVGVDEISDLALIKLNETQLPTLQWGDSDQLRVAEWVVAVGNPFQLSGTVTVGVVSTVSRSGAQVGSVADFIQTDAAINPGNSGGALVNTRGELVGINTRIYTETGGYQGIGFAVPSNLVRRIIDELKANGEVRWGSVGAVTWLTVTEAMAQRAGLGNLTGVYVRALQRGSAADRGGLRPEDIVISFNGERVTDAAQLQRLIITTAVGSTARVEVDRDGRRVTLQIPIAARR